VKRSAFAASALATGLILAMASTALAAFQIVQLSVSSAPVGGDVTIRVDASHMIGGSQQSELFLILQTAYDASPAPDQCDEIAGAAIVGTLQWQSATVEFQGATYPGFVGEGSFTVPNVETGVYVIAGILDNKHTGCHVFAPFGVGMELPDTALQNVPSTSPMARPGGHAWAAVGLALIGVSATLGRRNARSNRLVSRSS
jgi:hypothetical protein